MLQVPQVPEVRDKDWAWQRYSAAQKVSGAVYRQCLGSDPPTDQYRFVPVGEILLLREIYYLAAMAIEEEEK